MARAAAWIGRWRSAAGARGATTATAALSAVSPARAGASADALAMPEAFARLAAPPLFITGYGRSGTTWTFDLFDRHPDVCAIFETWLLTPGEGVTGVFHQPQWVRPFYDQQLQRIGMPHAAVQLVAYDVVARELGAVVAGWMSRAMKPEHRYLVEKGATDIPAVAAMFPAARVLHVLRDGRDVALSAHRAARSWAPEMGSHRPLSYFGDKWRQTVEQTRADGAELGDRFAEVRFEELQQDLSSAARRLFDFAQIRIDGPTLERVCAQTDLAGYDERVRRSGFRGGGSSSGWRRMMSRDAAKAFDATAGSLLVELGYAQDRMWWRDQPRVAAE